MTLTAPDVMRLPDSAPLVIQALAAKSRDALPERQFRHTRIAHGANPADANALLDRSRPLVADMAGGTPDAVLIVSTEPLRFEKFRAQFL
jgi:hypothetical protein